jgi:hypothetical protein
VPRHTDAPGVTRLRPTPNHRLADRLAEQYGRPLPRLDTRPGPDTAAGAYALAAVPAVERVPCLEERAPGLLVVRFRPVTELGWGA